MADTRMTVHGWLALVAICMGFLIIQLDATIVNVALPAIRHGLGGAVAGLLWVVDAYTLTLASALLATGSWGDRVLVGLIAAKGWDPSFGNVVFTTPTGRPVANSDLDRRFANALLAAGLPKIRLHDLTESRPRAACVS